MSALKSRIITFLTECMYTSPTLKSAQCSRFYRNITISSETIDLNEYVSKEHTGSVTETIQKHPETNTLPDSIGEWTLCMWKDAIRN